jgi:hypothetical protein
VIGAETREPERNPNVAGTVSDDLSLADLERDPDPHLARLRRDCPVAHVTSMDMWLVTRWDDVTWMEDHPELFSAATEPSFLARTLGPNMLTLDPPAATRVRAPMLGAFQPGGAAGRFVADELTPMADALIDRFVAAGEAELMSAYAEPLAAGSLAAVLGLGVPPEQMWAWCMGLCGDLANFENDPTLTAAAEVAKQELGAVIDTRLAQLRDHPEPCALADFLAATPEGGPLTRDEIINNVRLMISGGINEPRDGIGLVVATVLADPSLRELVTTEAAAWRRVVEEAFRLYSPVGTITRQATTDVEFGGVTVPAGALVAGVLRSANLDEARWTEPQRFDPARREGGHAAFATGAHRCLGEWLGRQEVKVGAQQLLARLPGLRLDPRHHPDGHVELHGFEFRGPREVWVVWG